MNTCFAAKVIQSANYLSFLMLSLSFAKNTCMKKIVLILVILVIAFSIYWFKFKTVDSFKGEKVQALKASIHSHIFTNNIDTMMNAYFNLKAAFVEADTLMAKITAKKFLVIATSLKLDELKKDTSGILETANMQLNDIKANAESLLKQTNITEMRQDFRMVGESIYPLLKTIHYEGKTLYWQNCPMAFGEGKEANWISNTEEIINPYLGKKDPEFKATMLHCGEVKDSIKAQ